MKTARDLINFIVDCHQYDSILLNKKNDNIVDIVINNNIIQIDLINNTFYIEGIKYDHERILD